MNSKELVLETMRKYGQAAARALCDRAADGTADGTELIAEESFIPDFVPGYRGYLTLPLKTPVRAEAQVWILIQNYDGSIYPGLPSTLRAQWGVAHTKDPAKAKPYVEPLGTSGLYYRDECCVDGGVTYRCMVEQTNFSPTAWPQGWKPVTT